MSDETLAEVNARHCAALGEQLAWWQAEMDRDAERALMQARHKTREAAIYAIGLFIAAGTALVFLWLR
jgi:hypothetical protein